MHNLTGFKLDNTEFDMTLRRDFLIGTGSMLGIAAVSPTLIAVSHASTLSDSDSLHPFKRWVWTALYDLDGSYITDVRLLHEVDKNHSNDVMQFSLIWRTRAGINLKPGTYVVDDFETEPRAIHLEPSDYGDRPYRYRASFSLLRQSAS